MNSNSTVSISTFTLSPSKVVSLPELDILRGFAAVLMVINHSLVKFFPLDIAKGGLIGISFFTSSFAPVLFFFITGFGYGLQDKDPKAIASSYYWHNALYKIFLLLVADYLLRGASEFGLDFLGFIAISMLIISVIRKTPRPIAVCSLLVLVSLGLRFLPFAPFEGSFLSWFLGKQDIINVSYPFSPWITYPCLGYIVGRLVAYSLTSKKQSLLGRKKLIYILLIFSTIIASITYFLWLKQASFFRWGTVGVGFYALSIFYIVVGCLALYIIRLNSLGESIKPIIGLRGISCLAVVPLHYTVIFIFASLIKLPVNAPIFLVVGAAIFYLTFTLARLTETFANFLQGLNVSNATFITTGLLLVVALTYLLGYLPTQTIASSLVTASAQLILCLMLVVKWR
jgi:uncharacterized membrane protein